MNILLLNCSLSSPNQGINALTIGTLTALASRFKEELNIVMLGEQSRFHNIDLGEIGTVAVQEIGLRTRHMPLLIIASFFHRHISMPYMKLGNIIGLSRFMARADYVIDLGAGDSFSDIYGLSRFVLQSIPRLAAIAHGKKLVFFPQTYGPFTSKIGKTMAVWLLKHTRFIFTREPFSTGELKLLTSMDRVIESSDMAFLMKPQIFDDLPSIISKEFIGVNVSGLLYFADDNPRLPWHSDQYRSLTIDIILKFVEDFNQDVVLVPHVFAPGDKTDDLAACEMVYAKLPLKIQERVHIIRQSLWAPQLKHLISRASFFVGARMHSCIAAISTGIPTVPISYSHKFLGVFNQLGLDELVCNPVQMTSDQMLARIDQIYCDRQSISLRISDATSKACARALETVNYI